VLLAAGSRVGLPVILIGPTWFFTALTSKKVRTMSSTTQSRPSFHLVIHGENDPSRGLNFRELWRHRDLLWFMTMRDITVRYRQTALGVMWAVLQPLLSAGVFSIFFGQIAKMPSDGVPYALFGFCGLILWLFFSNTIGRCSGSLVGNSGLLNKVYFPRVIIPLSNVFPGLIDFMIAFMVLLVGCLFYGMIPPVTALVWIPLVLVNTGLLALGCGLFLGALNVRFRDVNNGVSFLLQLMMFATPVVYPVSLVNEKYRWIMALNPMVGMIETLRSGLFGRPVDLQLLGISIVTACIAMYFGGRYFFKVEKHFADII
jgi:lipopolysaccharide transport system permease protein